MKKEEILIRLIEHYEKAIEDLTKLNPNRGEFKHYIVDNDIGNGICYCAFMRLGVKIYKKDWVVRNYQQISDEIKSSYWGPILPIQGTYKEFIVPLKHRILIMKQELLIPEKNEN
jgi:hypothetical protein